MADIDSLLHKKLIGLCAICAGAIGLTILGLLLPIRLVVELENRTWDWRSQIVSHSRQADPRIKIIVIDQSSLDHFAKEEKIFWPWPRGLYEPIIQFLTRAGARGVAFDILFTEQSSYGVEDDQQFGRSVAGVLPVVSAVAVRRGAAGDAAEDLQVFARRQREIPFMREYSASILDAERGVRFAAATLPIPELLAASAGFGNVMVDPDGDGVFRHGILGAYVGRSPLFSLPFALGFVGQGGGSSFAWLKEYADEEGRLAVSFREAARGHETFSFASILRSEQALGAGRLPVVNPASFKDTLVFVGMTAPGLLDLRPTPLNPRGAGVEFNATVLDNLLHREFVRKVPWKLTAMGTGLFITALACGLILARTPQLHALVLGTVGVGFIGGSLWLALLGWWIPMVIPGGVLTLVAWASVAFQFQLEGRQHRFIRNAFKFYVSPSVIDRIVADPGSLSLGGEKKELTIYFSDIQGFTTISEQLEATKLVDLLNTFLSEMTAVILSHGGTVDKYVGDAIVAFWNAPLSQSDHPLRGVQAAIECQQRLDELRPQLKEKHGVEVRMRVGLHTGAVNVGNFGSRERFNYTVLGDAANLASRLEGANKNFGTYIMISEGTWERVQNVVPCRKLGGLRVVGKNEAVNVFEPLIVSAAQTVEEQQTYERARALFEAGDLRGARAVFASIGGDPVAKAYLKRIDKELEHSEGGTFSPVWNLTEK